MSETKKKYRLFKVAKELNTGSSTLVEHLESKGFEVNNSPNEKLSEEMYNILLKDFASEKVLKQKAEQIKEQKREERLAAEEPRQEEEDEILSAEQLKSGILEGNRKKVAAEVTESQPVAKVETPAVETPPTPEPEAETGKKGPALRVKGKIDLSQFERKGKGKPKAKQEEKPPAKKEAPKVEQNPVEQPPKAEPVKEEKKAEPVKEEKPVAKAKTAKAEPVKEEKPEEKAEEKKEKKVVRASSRTPKLAGLNVLGKIELPADRKSKAKKDAKSSDGDGEDGEKKKRKRRRKRKKATSVNPNQQQKKGGTRERKKKEELSEKEISDIIKSTLADLNRGAGRSRQRMRREKRDQDAKRREQEAMQRAAEARILEVTEFITANELANLVNLPVTNIITKCLELGLFVSINQRLEADVIQLLAEEYGYEVKFVDIADKEYEEVDDEVDEAELEGRAPIITVMGHVDHGKTSLLDYIRNANVIAGEAGGITQHIGAYEVTNDDGKRICFLDTPGHEAFTAMRARGAKVTDLVIIVVAADDSVMPQTKEAINHAQAAGVPMIFALNKMDKPGADSDRIRTQLSEMDILLEDWGGKYQSQEISAKTGMGVDDLLEKVLLEAELLELEAAPTRSARGTVVEAKLDKGRGVVATLLVQDGTLRVGDNMVAGVHFGRVRAMMDERGNRIEEAGPSTPVQLLGLTGTPQAGDRFVVYAEERKAKEVASKRNELVREQNFRQNKRRTLDDIARLRALGDFKELNIIVKGDVDGSVEALSDSLLKLSIDEIQVNVIRKAVGQITEADVLLASASEAIIIGFQVRPSVGARKLAETEGIDIRLYSVIYDAINEVHDALEGMLSPDIKEEISGTAEIREVFKISKVGSVAGCMVVDGQFIRKEPVRLIRDGIVIYDGKLASLKRFKDDVREVNKGFECGMQIDGYNDIKVGDLIEQYKTMEIQRKLS